MLLAAFCSLPACCAPAVLVGTVLTGNRYLGKTGISDATSPASLRAWNSAPSSVELCVNSRFGGTFGLWEPWTESRNNAEHPAGLPLVLCYGVLLFDGT